MADSTAGERNTATAPLPPPHHRRTAAAELPLLRRPRGVLHSAEIRQQRTVMDAEYAEIWHTKVRVRPGSLRNKPVNQRNCQTKRSGIDRERRPVRWLLKEAPGEAAEKRGCRLTWTNGG